MHQQKFMLFDIIEGFFAETGLQWEHGHWLELLSKVEQAGYDIDADQLGKLLENERYRRQNVFNNL